MVKYEWSGKQKGLVHLFKKIDENEEVSINFFGFYLITTESVGRKEEDSYDYRVRYIVGRHWNF